MKSLIIFKLLNKIDRVFSWIDKSLNNAINQQTLKTEQTMHLKLHGKIIFFVGVLCASALKMHKKGTFWIKYKNFFML